MTFKFAQITDTHYYGIGDNAETPFPWPERDELFKGMLRECAAHGIEFIVHTGDFCSSGAGYEKNAHFYSLLKGGCDELGLGLHCTRGNHDRSLSDEEYAGIYGDGTYWFEHKGWAFVSLDRYYRCYEHVPSYFDMNPATLDRLDEMLPEIEPEMPMVLLLHENPIGTTRFPRGEALLHHLRNHNLQLLLFGHVQNNSISRVEGVPYVTVVGEAVSFDSAPLTYNIVTCRDAGEAVCDFHPHVAHLPPPPDHAATAPQSGAPAARPGTDWLGMRGPFGTRRAADPLPETAPKLAWQAELPGVIAVGAPTISNGTLVLGTKTKGRFEQCLIRAFDAATGDVRWTTAADASVEGGVLLDGGRGYCGTTAGSVYCLDLTDGSVLWQWNNRENLPIACEPTLDEGLLHLGANWEMYALDAATGETVWRKLSTPVGVSYFAPGHASPLVVNETVYHQRTFNAGGRQSLMQSVNKRTGDNLEWGSPQYQNFPGQRHSSPVLHDGKIVTVGGGLLVFEPGNLQEALIFTQQGSGCSMPAIEGSTVYVSYHHALVAHDLNDGGRQLWSAPHEPALMQFSGAPYYGVLRGQPARGNFSSPLVSGDKVLVCDTAGHCRCLSAAEGRELWRISVGSPILCAPVVSGNTLTFGDYAGRLYAFAW